MFDQMSDGHFKATGPVHSEFGAGKVPAAISQLVTARNRGIFPAFQTFLRFDALPVSIGNAGSGAGFGTIPIYNFPAGYIEVRDFNAYFTRIAFNVPAGSDGTIGGGGSGDYSFGSTATADATLSSTDADLLASTAMLDPFVTGVGNSNAWARLAAAAVFNGSTTPLTANLNVIIDDADVGDLSSAAATVYFTGYARFTWLSFGDNETTI